jgi:hypothetical protein
MPYEEFKSHGHGLAMGFPGMGGVNGWVCLYGSK